MKKDENYEEFYQLKKIYRDTVCISIKLDIISQYQIESGIEMPKCKREKRGDVLLRINNNKCIVVSTSLQEELID